MIKRYVLERVDFEGDTVVIGRYKTYYTALSRYNLLTTLRVSLGVLNGYRYRIVELPLLHTVYKKDIITKVSEVVKSFDEFNIAIYHCGCLNKNSDGTVRYYVRCALKEED